MHPPRTPPYPRVHAPLGHMYPGYTSGLTLPGGPEGSAHPLGGLPAVSPYGEHCCFGVFWTPKRAVLSPKRPLLALSSPYQTAESNNPGRTPGPPRGGCPPVPPLGRADTLPITLRSQPWAHGPGLTKLRLKSEFRPPPPGALCPALPRG